MYKLGVGINALLVILPILITFFNNFRLCYIMMTMTILTYTEYAYTMKVTEKCDVYSYGVVLLELLTGKKPIQSIDQGGDLVTWVRNHIHNHSLSIDILDARLDLLDEMDVAQTFDVLKIALFCTNSCPSKRPSMREVVSMLTSSCKRTEQVSSSQCSELS